ncbi:MAG TPA: polysaccharide deacetylase family protein [Flavisolibacter sp.]|nr:polysaccharide deacetylase family protein [Flavisolibacter sp.]
MHPRNRITVPIVMLHGIGITNDAALHDWFISKEAFRQLLDVIEKHRLTTSHFADIAGRKGETSGQVILSFDDCYKHLFDFAIPELVKRKMKAVFYMPTAHIGHYNTWDVDKGSQQFELMNGNDLRELARLGMEVGSHSHNHIDLRKADDNQLAEELLTSKQILEEITAHRVYSIAYPYGHVPAAYKSALPKAGYQYGVTIYHPFENNLALRRFGVYEKDSAESLSKKLSVRYRWMRKVYDALKKYD